MPKNNRETLACNKLKGPKATPFHEEGLSAVNDESKIPEKNQEKNVNWGWGMSYPESWMTHWGTRIAPPVPLNSKSFVSYQKHALTVSKYM